MPKIGGLMAKYEALLGPPGPRKSKNGHEPLQVRIFTPSCLHWQLKIHEDQDLRDLPLCAIHQIRSFHPPPLPQFSAVHNYLQRIQFPHAPLRTSTASHLLPESENVNHSITTPVVSPIQIIRPIPKFIQKLFQ